MARRRRRGLNGPKSIAEARNPLRPFNRYLARALIDDSEAAGQICDAMVAMTEQLMPQGDEQTSDPLVADSRTRAALIVAMTLDIPAFQAHISRSICTDIYSLEGDRRIALALLDIYSHPVLSPESARTLRQGLDKQIT